MLSGIALFFLILSLKSNTPKVKPGQMPTEDSEAELISATGAVFVGKSDGTEWHQVSVGAHLMEGDLVRTDKSGDASVRYSDGSTVSIQARTIFTVRNTGDGSMEISVPSKEVDAPSTVSGQEPEAYAQTAEKPEKGGRTSILGNPKEASPFIRLDRIIPFGRSLELIGSIEAGSTLAVNNEIVDVSGDGSFKHFTNPFPASVQKVRLVMKVKDLAGRTRIVTTTHDFDPKGWDN
jgi:hypothetical protein